MINMAKVRINTIRDLNRKRVLEFIIANQPTSRAAISRSIKLTKATVSAIVSELIDANVLIESHLFESTGGRKPIKIIINKNSYHVISIDFSRGHIIGALINLNGEIIYKKSVETINEKDIEITLQQTYDLIDSIIIKLSNKSTWKAVSISIDGSVKRNQHIKLAHTKGWENINMNQYIEDRYNIKCFTNNEANLAALGENSFFRQTDDLTMISMLTGVGLGSIQNRALIEGFDGLAGEIGHTIVNINGIPCSCGNNGCIEQYVSVSSVRNKLAIVKRIPIDIPKIVHLFNEGDSDTVQILNEYCKYLGVLINNTINLVNPNELIIANDLLNALPELLQTALKYINLTVSSCHSVRLSSSNDIELLGAAVVAIQDFLHIKHYYPNKAEQK